MAHLAVVIGQYFRDAAKTFSEPRDANFIRVCARLHRGCAGAHASAQVTSGAAVAAVQLEQEECMRRKGWRSSIAVLVVALAVTRVDAQVGEGRIAVDAAAPTRPFPHFWERMFGSGRALLTLRESYRQDLRAVRGVTAVAHIPLPGLFHDELGGYAEAPHGEPLYNFSHAIRR